MSREPKGACSALAAIVAVLGFSGVANARTFRVNKTADHATGACTRADCTLREAVIAANARTGPDTILLRGGKVYGLALAGAGENFSATGDLDVIDPLTIKPAAPRRGHRARRATIDGNDLDRVLQALDSVSISRLVIRDGNAAQVGGEGGGIESDGAPVAISRSVLRENMAIGEGGAVDIDDDALEGGRLTILRSVITANSANAGGGVSADEVSTVVRRSTISANQSTGGVAGGIRQTGGSLEVSASTVSRNVSASTAGGLRYGEGGPPSTVTLTNVTVEGNRAASSGGGMRISSGTGSLTAVTIIRNTGGADGVASAEGGGLQEDSVDPVSVKSSIIALNTIGAGTGPDCYSDAGYVSGGHNLLGSTDPDCTGFTGIGDGVSGSPLLGALRNNGGPTKTACPQKGSPAINAGASDSPARDQRGRKRVGRPDVGACEFTPRKKKKRR